MVRDAPTFEPILTSCCNLTTNTSIVTAGDQAQPDHRQEPLVFPLFSRDPTANFHRLEANIDHTERNENTDRNCNQTSERTGNAGFNATSTRYALNDGYPTCDDGLCANERGQHEEPSINEKITMASLRIGSDIKLEYSPARRPRDVLLARLRLLPLPPVLSTSSDLLCDALPSSTTAVSVLVVASLWLS